MQAPKYTTIMTPQELGFLEYFMLPESDEFDYVYRPGDDSFLLLSVLKNELKTFSHNATICEIGSGSGILSAHLNKWLKDEGKEALIHIATDISLDACLLSQKYYKEYGLNVEQICTSLLKATNFEPEIIICNPPYVPTDPEEKQSETKYLSKKLSNIQNPSPNIKRSPETNLIAFSYMGGPEGLDTTRLLILSINWCSKMYLIVMGDEGMEILREEVESGKILAEGMKANYEVLQFNKKMNEELFVVCIHFKK